MSASSSSSSSSLSSPKPLTLSDSFSTPFPPTSSPSILRQRLTSLQSPQCDEFLRKDILAPFSKFNYLSKYPSSSPSPSPFHFVNRFYSSAELCSHHTKLLQFAFDLTKVNMEFQYNLHEDFKWSDKKKLSEFKHKEAKFIVTWRQITQREKEQMEMENVDTTDYTQISQNNNNNNWIPPVPIDSSVSPSSPPPPLFLFECPVSFCHFRFESDSLHSYPIIYLYELQVQKKYHRMGLGKYLMSILDIVQSKLGTYKIQLTVIKTNHTAKTFYKQKCKYSRDEDDPNEEEEEEEEDKEEKEENAHRNDEKTPNPKNKSNKTTNPIPTPPHSPSDSPPPSLSPPIGYFILSKLSPKWISWISSQSQMAILSVRNAKTQKEKLLAMQRAAFE